MSPRQHSTPAVDSASARPSSLLRAARLLWVVVAAFYLLLWLASLPAFFESATAGTVPVVIRFGNSVQTSNDVFQQWAATWGLSVAAWTWVHVLLTGLSLMVFYGVTVLLWSRVRTWFGWLTVMVLTLVQASGSLGPVIYTARPPAIVLVVFDLATLVWPFCFVWLYQFPDGKWVPRRLLWFFGPFVVIFFALSAVMVADAILPLPSTWRAVVEARALYTLSTLTLSPLVLTSLAAQVYRYRRVSGPVERAQTRWFLIGLALMVVPSITIALEPIVSLPAEINTISLTMLPIAVGVAILRYRLYDVDVIIRKTLIYSVVSAVLALVFFGLVIALQRLSVIVTGQESPVATVASTLAIVVLFNPLRRRVQFFIDRRFYRKKYDAQQVLARFAAAAGDEADIGSLAAQLTAAVHETVQPVHVSVWLAPKKVADQ